MSAVDVLAVMDRDASEAKFMRKRAASPHVEEMARDSAEARAAVAELIEAAEGVWNTPRPAGSDPNGRYSKAEKRLAAALAAITEPQS